VLAQRDAALCLYEFAGQEALLEVTADCVHIRRHGPDGPYRGSYGDAALRTWAKGITAWAEVASTSTATPTTTTAPSRRKVPCACDECCRRGARAAEHHEIMCGIASS
jgi:hypothetical protein